MKSTTVLQLFSAGILSLTSTATAQTLPDCAISCFTKVVTEHPPLDCTEPNMYLCFCKRVELQNYFNECAYLDLCPSTTDAQAAVGFGVSICDQLGVPIVAPPPPSTPIPTPSTSSSPPAPPAVTSSSTPPPPPPAKSSTTSTSFTSSPLSPPAASTSAAKPSSSKPSVSSVSSTPLEEDGPAALASTTTTKTKSSSTGTGVAVVTHAPSTVSVSKADALSFTPSLIAAVGVAVAAFQFL